MALITDGCRTHDLFGYPTVVDKPEIPDPKKILLASVSNMDALRAQLVSTRQDYVDGNWLGPIDDAIEVLSMPVFMMAQATESMYVVTTSPLRRLSAAKKHVYAAY